MDPAINDSATDTNPRGNWLILGAVLAVIITQWSVRDFRVSVY